MSSVRSVHPPFNGDLAVFHIVAHQPSGVLLLVLPHRLSFSWHFRMSPNFRYRISHPYVKSRINRRAVHARSTGNLPAFAYRRWSTAYLRTSRLFLGVGLQRPEGLLHPCLASRRLARGEILPLLSITCGNPPQLRWDRADRSIFGTAFLWLRPLRAHHCRWMVFHQVPFLIRMGEVC